MRRASVIDDERLSRPASKRGKLQREVLRILKQHEADGALPTSGRFVFYELEQAGIVSKVKTGVRRPDQNVLEALTYLRDEGAVPWDWIEDEMRHLDVWQVSSSVKTYLLNAVDSASLNPWGEDAPAPIIITESRSLAGVLRDLASEYSVPIGSTNGPCTGFLMTKVLSEYEERRRVLYLGDLDDAGLDIEEHTRRILEDAGGEARLWERLAITQAQVRQRGLKPIWKTDSRHKPPKRYRAWETEALSQKLVVQIVRQRLDALLPRPLDRVHVREARQRQAARRWLKRMPDTR